MKDRLKEIKKIEPIINKLIEEGITHGIDRSLRYLCKEIEIYKNHIRGLLRIKNNKNIIKSRKVQIGGGRHYLQGFLNIDIVSPADIIFDVREGLPLETNYADLIFCEHFIEHIDYPFSVKKFIRECFRVLKKNGKLIIGVPDSELIIFAYVKKDKKFWKQMLKRWYLKRNCFKHFNTYIDLVNYHFRDQDDSSKYNPHYWAYDFEKLTDLIKTSGFTKIKKWKFDASIANQKREWGSLYVEAIKK